MDFRVLHDKSIILAALKKDTELQIYGIGDLDDFFWNKSIYFALTDNNNVFSTAQLYVSQKTPTLLAFCNAEFNYTYKLLERLKSILPNQFIAHLSPGLSDVFGKENIIENYGTSYKMSLKKEGQEIGDTNIRKLTAGDLKIMQDFYIVSYPQNWFDSRMLDTNKYYGYFVYDKLVGISGVHVYSEKYKVAALGNIATHPDHRGQQIGYKLTSVLCNDLIKNQVEFIGLNVKSENTHAMNCYKKIGFEIIGKYDECMIKNDCN
jgi:ribosomal protein S18 acetylase RimI-like enzyme